MENGELSPRKSRLLKALECGSDDEKNSRIGSRSRSSGRGRSVSPQQRRILGSAGSNGSRASSADSRYLSRSPSRSSSEPSGYRSRSQSFSPDRMNTD